MLAVHIMSNPPNSARCHETARRHSIAHHTRHTSSIFYRLHSRFHTPGCSAPRRRMFWISPSKYCHRDLHRRICCIVEHIAVGRDAVAKVSGRCTSTERLRRSFICELVAILSKYRTSHGICRRCPRAVLALIRSLAWRQSTMRKYPVTQDRSAQIPHSTLLRAFLDLPSSAISRTATS